ncbi:unnamed protein product [Closterium sp. NIES-65]|nr:unnamed protein product [Closterium sp. NIES-65]
MAARDSGKAAGGGGKGRGKSTGEGEGGEGEWWREPLWQGAMIVGGAAVAVGLGVKYLMEGKGEEGAQTHKGKGKVRRDARDEAWRQFAGGGGAVSEVPDGGEGGGRREGTQGEREGEAGTPVRSLVVRRGAKVRRHVQALVVDPDMTVKVHKGDTLWGLAHKYQVPVDALRSANPEVRGDQVLAGSRLYIPNVISDEEFDVRANEE